MAASVILVAALLKDIRLFQRLKRQVLVSEYTDLQSQFRFANYTAFIKRRNNFE